MNTYFAIGLMSGTSLDGLDICYTKFTFAENKWSFNIIHAETIIYPTLWIDKLKFSKQLQAADLLALHSEYGFYLGETVTEFISKYKILRVDVISSHGHTVHHQPERRYTCQIGDARAIKLKNNYPIVYDFRSQDVLMGGNGAPLVPIGDEYLFSKYFACLNLGGFSNISFKDNNERIAFDISPFNIVINLFSEQLGKAYDEDGKIASTGMIDDSLLKQLNNLEYYQKSEPKSLGVEFVEAEILPLMQNIIPETAIATFTEHAALQIAAILNKNKIKNVLLTGGGTLNKYFIKNLSAKTAADLVVPTEDIINFKEAVIFAFMGVLKLRGEVNTLASATGSSADHSSGLLI